MMTSEERVLAACAFHRPDRVPRFDSFWDLPDAWRQEIGELKDLTDIQIWAADETPFPSRKTVLKEQDGWLYERDGWGSTFRTRPGTYFHEVLEVAIPEGADPDRVTFEDPASDGRYLMGRQTWSELRQELDSARREYCVFAKTGGPFLRTTLLRGEKQFLMDIATDEVLARNLAEKVGSHLCDVGVESITRWGLTNTGIWIYDDVAFNEAPLFSPSAFERVFLPVYSQMISRYKAAGAKYVFFHSDGNINPFVDMLVDAGISGLHPLERRAGVDPFLLRERYPKLVLAGGMCNTDILINGPVDRIEVEARKLIELARDGGLIIGTHSVSPEVPLEHFRAYDRICRRYGVFTE